MISVDYRNLSNLKSSIKTSKQKIFDYFSKLSDSYKQKINIIQQKAFEKPSNASVKLSSPRYKYYVGLAGFILSMYYLGSQYRNNQKSFQQTLQNTQNQIIPTSKINDQILSQKNREILERQSDYLRAIKGFEVYKQNLILSQVQKSSKMIKKYLKFSFDVVPHLILLALMIKTAKNIISPQKYLGIALGFGCWVYYYPSVSIKYHTLCKQFIKQRIMPVVNNNLYNHYKTNFTLKFITTFTQTKFQSII